MKAKRKAKTKAKRKTKKHVRFIRGLVSGPSSIRRVQTPYYPKTRKQIKKRYT